MIGLINPLRSSHALFAPQMIMFIYSPKKCVCLIISLEIIMFIYFSCKYVIYFPQKCFYSFRDVYS